MIATDNSIKNVKTYGIMYKFHNKIIGDAGLDISANWRETEFTIKKNYYHGKIAKINVKLETPHYFSAEYLNLFTGAKFDFFTEDGDIYRGEESTVIREVFRACHSYFKQLQGDRVKDFFNGISDSENPLDFNADKDLIGKVATDSFVRMYQDCIEEKAYWTTVASRRGFLKNL